MNLLYALARPFRSVAKLAPPAPAAVTTAQKAEQPPARFQQLLPGGRVQLGLHCFPSQSQGARNDNKIVLGAAGSGRSLLLAQLTEAAHAAGNQIVYLSGARGGLDQRPMGGLAKRVGARQYTISEPEHAVFNPFWFAELGAASATPGVMPSPRQLQSLASVLEGVLQLTRSGRLPEAGAVAFPVQQMLEQELASYYSCRPWLFEQGGDMARSGNRSQAWHPLEGPGFNSFYEFVLKRWAQAWMGERIENPATPQQRCFLQWLNRAGAPFYAGGPIDGLLNGTPDQVASLTYRHKGLFLAIDLVSGPSFATVADVPGSGAGYWPVYPAEALQRILLLLLHTVDARLGAASGRRLTLVLDELHYSLLGPHVAHYLSTYLADSKHYNRDLLIAWHEWPQSIFTADKPAAQALLAASATQVLVAPATPNPHVSLKERYGEPLGLDAGALRLLENLPARHILVYQPASRKATVFAAQLSKEEVKRRFSTCL